jgi:hypothetical protein
MARQAGKFKITGTIDDVTYYKMDGQYYARKKSSLKGKRVKKDPRFKRTMQSAHRLGRGSQLASRLYRSLSRQEQVKVLYKELKSLAIRVLKDGRSEEEILVILKQRLIAKGFNADVEKPITTLPVKKKKKGTERKRVFIQERRKSLFSLPGYPAHKRSRGFAST